MTYKKGHTVSSHTRKCISNTLKGHKLSKETRQKISDSLKIKYKNKEIKTRKGVKQPSTSGNKNPAKRPEAREKIRQSKLGNKNPMKRQELRLLMKETSLKNWKDENFRNKHTGENHHSWIKDRKLFKYGVGFNNHIKKEIRMRDKHNCVECKINEKLFSRKLHIHHIDYNKKNDTEQNLISLCVCCHAKTNYNREEWKMKYGKMIGEIYGRR